MPFPDVWAGVSTPAPVPPPSDEAIEAIECLEPTCFQCRFAPPVELTGLGRAGDLKAYCSLECAALSGLQFLRESEYVRCACGRWSDCLGYCPVCDARIELSDRHNALLAELECPDESGVSHDA